MKSGRSKDEESNRATDERKKINRWSERKKISRG